MKTSLILTLSGTDRPGIVSGLAELVAKHGGNWTESRMARLAGHFAGILHAEVPAEQCDALMQALRAMQTAGLSVVVTPAEPAPAHDDHYGLHLELVGHDRPGIVHQITTVIRRHGINIEELETTTERAPQTDDLLFKAIATLRVPATVTAAKLRQDLEAIATELMVDLSLKEPGHVR